MVAGTFLKRSFIISQNLELIACVNVHIFIERFMMENRKQLFEPQDAC